MQDMAGTAMLRAQPENMEVLMKVKSTQQRLSRALVIGVGVTLTFGMVFWAYNLGRSHGVASISKAERTAKASREAVGTQAAVAIVPPPATAPSASVLTTPSAPPTSAPVL